MITHSICRVCGTNFPSPRCDAITCTDTCRQRLKRGQAFAYLASLSKAEQRAQRRYHEAVDASIAATKAATASRRAYRDTVRTHRQQKAEQQWERERERVVAEVVGRAYLTEQKKQREQATLKTTASVLMLFAKERRNDMSAEAIAELINMPDDYPIEEIRLALDQLHASGDYDRIVNEAAPL